MASEPSNRFASPVEVRPVETPIRVAFRNIVVATDFSPASERALNYAIAIARRYEAHIYLAHVIRPDLYTLQPLEASGGMIELVHQAAEQEMAELLISGRLREVPHQAVIREGEVWTVLEELAGENEADLIVLGTHGRTGFEKMFLGSVAERVFRLSERPVLTVGPGVAKQAPEEAELKHIVYATDFSTYPRGALPYALSLAQEHQARLTLLHIVENEPDVAPETITRLRHFFTERLRALLPPGADLWCYPEFVVSFGDPVERILEVAEDNEADLVVLGIRGGGVAVAHMPPANAYRIVCQATCPVLTVRG